MFEFGEKLKLTLFGKSHSPYIGGILDGVPDGLRVDMKTLEEEMALRKPCPGMGTSRREKDEVEFLQGLNGDRTDGNPLLFIIRNADVSSRDYDVLANVPRPGHSDLPAMVRFPDHDIRGGGWFSGRLTAPMVAAGSVAKQMLSGKDIRVGAFSRAIGGVYDEAPRGIDDAHGSRMFPTRACTGELDRRMEESITSASSEDDSVGGIVGCVISGLPIGFGGIWFESLDSELARAMLSIPGCKGVGFGDGFALSGMRGSQSNDPYRFVEGRIVKESNHMGGIVGGMCDGSPVTFDVAFKPTPSIARPQRTVDLRDCRDRMLSLTGRHDPCIVPRAVAAVEAMAALTVADQMLRGFRGQTDLRSLKTAFIPFRTSLRTS